MLNVNAFDTTAELVYTHNVMHACMKHHVECVQTNGWGMCV